MTKAQMLEAIRSLPDDATVADATERLELLEAIERGIADADAGRKMSQEEAYRRAAQWRA